jgi:hypothetical protein
MALDAPERFDRPLEEVVDFPETRGGGGGCEGGLVPPLMALALLAWRLAVARRDTRA